MDHKISDAVFEGMLAAALEEYVNTSAEATPTDEALEEMYPLPKRLARKYKKIAKARKYKLPLPLIYLRRVAVVLLAFVSLTFVILATNSNVRAAVTDAIVQWYKEYINIDFGKLPDSDASDEIPDLDALRIGYIPDGFELTSSNEDSDLREYVYATVDEKILIVGLYSSETADVGVDIEDVTFEEITINDDQAFLSYNESFGVGTLVVGNSKYMIVISGELEKSELIKIAENIKPGETKNYDELCIGYIPDGYELASADESTDVREYIYTADDGGYIFIGIYSSKSASVAVDIEDVEYEEMTINNNKAYIVYDEVDGAGSIVVGNSRYTISITSYLEKSELIKIAENIK